MKNKLQPWIIIFLTFTTLLVGARGKDIEQKITGLEKKLAQVSGEEKVKVLNQLAYLYSSKSPAKCLEYGNRALASAQKLDLPGEEAKALNNIGKSRAYLGDSEKALKNFQQALAISKKIKDRKGTATTLNNIGNIYDWMSDYRKSLAFYLESLKIEKEAGNKQSIAMVLGNIGNSYHHLGDNTKALDYHLKSLKISEELGNKRQMAMSLHNVGRIYGALNRIQTALEYFQKSLKYKEEIGDNIRISSTLTCIGSGYQRLKDYDRALEYHKKALKTAEEMGLKRDIAYGSGNLGSLYEEMGDYKHALEYYRKTLKIEKERGEKWGIGRCFIAIGKIHFLLRDYPGARKNMEQGLKIAKEIDSKNLTVKSCINFSRLYAAKGDYKKALEYYKRFHQTSSDILNEKNQEQINKLQAEYEAEKKAKEIEVLKKNNEIQDLKLSKAEFSRNASIAGFVLVVIILALLFKKYVYLFAFWKKKKHIGQFRLMDKIGSGGMGTIFKAHTITGKSEIAAVKILKQELFADEINKKRFKRESAIIDKLEHPHIVKIKERGESGQQLFIAMEFLEGKTLEDRIGEEGQLPLNDALHIMIQVSETVGFIHGKNVIHRDLKPANIMLIEKNGDPDYVKLLDFGLARVEFETRVTQSGNFLGSIEYISPEQVLDAHSSPAGDIFAMGVTFYRMLCGKNPFPGETVIDTMRKIIGEDPGDLPQSGTEIPLELNRLVMTMMHKKPDHRPTAESIKDTLNSIDSGTGIS